MATDLWITGNPETDALLSDDPFALLVGMLLDQPTPKPSGITAGQSVTS